MCEPRGRRHSSAASGGVRINRTKTSAPSEVQDPPTAHRVSRKASKLWHKDAPATRYSRQQAPSAVARKASFRWEPAARHAIRRTGDTDRIAPPEPPACPALPRPKHPAAKGNPCPMPATNILTGASRVRESTPLSRVQRRSLGLFQTFLAWSGSTRPSSCDIRSEAPRPRRAAQDSGIGGFSAGQIRHSGFPGAMVGWRLPFDSAYLIWTWPESSIRNNTFKKGCLLRSMKKWEPAPFPQRANGSTTEQRYRSSAQPPAKWSRLDNSKSRMIAADREDAVTAKSRKATLMMRVRW